MRLAELRVALVTLAPTACGPGHVRNSFGATRMAGRIAMISEHASPLAATGSVDAGGQNEKANQAIQILQEQQTDLWLTFVRETSGVRDPVLDLLIGPGDLTWQSALILTRKGEKIAIIGNLEKDALARLGVFDEILGYDKSIRELLRETISRLDPDRIAVNTSRNNVHADGLTYAMHEILRDHLADTPYTDRLISAEAVISSLRGRVTNSQPTYPQRLFNAQKRGMSNKLLT